MCILRAGFANTYLLGKPQVKTWLSVGPIAARCSFPAHICKEEHHKTPLPTRVDRAVPSGPYAQNTHICEHIFARKTAGYKFAPAASYCIFGLVYGPTEAHRPGQARPGQARLGFEWWSQTSSLLALFGHFGSLFARLAPVAHLEPGQARPGQARRSESLCFP